VQRGHGGRVRYPSDNWTLAEISRVCVPKNDVEGLG